MNGTDLYNALTEIDEKLIDRSLAPEKKTSGRASNGRRTILRTVALAASFALILAVILVINGVSNRSPGPVDSGETGIFTLKVSAAQVYIDGKEDEKYASKGNAEYIFEKPAEEDLRYTGCWISKEVLQAFEFRSDGIFTLFILKDPTHYRLKYSGYYSISGDKVTLFLPEEEKAGVCELRFDDSSIAIKPQNDQEMTFERYEGILTAVRNEVKNSTDAMDFRNIPWTHDPEKLIISFGYQVGGFSHVGQNDRVDFEYYWDSQSNTVKIPDWNKDPRKIWTGRIDKGCLVLSSGDQTVVLYDPAEEAQSIPNWLSLKEENEERPDYLAAFYFDLGKYSIGYRDKEGNLVFSYHGECVFTRGGSEDREPLLKLYPSKDDCSFLPSDSAFRYFSDLCDLEGEEFTLTEADGRFLLKNVKTGLEIVLYSNESIKEKQNR